MMNAANFALLAALLLPAAACAKEPKPTPPAQNAGVIDSFVPREVALERFRKGMEPVDTLSHASPSRDELVRRFVRALEARDTADLRVMRISPAEFAWLFYPTDPQGLPPYDLNPDLRWFLIQGETDKGIRRALDYYGGRPLNYTGYQCDSRSSRQGENTVWGPCVVAIDAAPGKHENVRLFGLLMERAGRWKFVSYGNKL